LFKRRAISQRVIEKATRERLGYGSRKFGLAFRKISAAGLLVLFLVIGMNANHNQLSHAQLAVVVVGESG
jgi:hypothetical protein